MSKSAKRAESYASSAIIGDWGCYQIRNEAIEAALEQGYRDGERAMLKRVLGLITEKHQAGTVFIESILVAVKELGDDH